MARLKIDVYNDIEDTTRELSMAIWSSKRDDNKIASIIEQLRVLKEELNTFDELEGKLEL